MSDLIECPHFKQWIVRNLTRMDIDLQRECSLTSAATRMRCMSTPVVDSHNLALAFDAMRATTNLIDRLKKGRLY